MKRLRAGTLLPLVFIAGCIDWSSLGNADLAGADQATASADASLRDAELPVSGDAARSPIDLATGDNEATEQSTDLGSSDLLVADFAVAGDAATPMNSIALTGAFNGGAVIGGNNGITLRGQFLWHAAITGSAKGISLTGAFR